MAQLRYKQALACGTAITAVGLVGIYLYQKKKGGNHDGCDGTSENECGDNKQINYKQAEEKLVQDIMREKARLEEESKNGGKNCNCEEGCSNNCRGSKTDIESLHETLNKTLNQNCIPTRDKRDHVNREEEDKLLANKLPDVISHPLVEEFLALSEEMELLSDSIDIAEEAVKSDVVEEPVEVSNEVLEESSLSVEPEAEIVSSEPLVTTSFKSEILFDIPDASVSLKNSECTSHPPVAQKWQESSVDHTQVHESKESKTKVYEKEEHAPVALKDHGNQESSVDQSPQRSSHDTDPHQSLDLKKTTPLQSSAQRGQGDAAQILEFEVKQVPINWASAMDEVEEKKKADVASPVSNNNGVTESPTGGSDGGSEVNSEGSSSDSGRGSSETSSVGKGQPVIPEVPELPVLYQFEFPTTLCGRLIGKQGRNIKDLRDKTGAKVFLKNLAVTDKYQLCIVEGLPKSVEAALSYIKKRFPDVDTTRQKLTADSQGKNVALPSMSQLHLPEEVINDTILSSVVTAGHVFVQQPTHPTYSALNRLDNCMNMCYSHIDAVPPLPKPLEVGIICAAPVIDSWYRAQIVNYYPEEDEADVRFLDYGGYGRMDANLLRQIRSDFLTLPFQAVECYLANVAPLQGEMYFSDDARLFIEQVAQNFAILQCQITAYSMDGLPLVELFYTESENGNVHSINRELVDRGLVMWYEGLEETVTEPAKLKQV